MPRGVVAPFAHIWCDVGVGQLSVSNGQPTAE